VHINIASKEKLTQVKIICLHYKLLQHICVSSSLASKNTVMMVGRGEGLVDGRFVGVTLVLF
jgi:hypothetical protein